MARRKKNVEDMSIETDMTEEEVREGRQEPTPKKRGRKSKTHVEKEIREQLQAFMSSAALIWSAKDQICAGALHDNSEAIATGLARLCAKSKHAAKIAESITDTAIWVPFGIGLSNFAMTVYHHHAMPQTDETESAPDDVYAYAATGGGSPRSMDSPQV